MFAMSETWPHPCLTRPKNHQDEDGVEVSSIMVPLSIKREKREYKKKKRNNNG
jgi:hypothetical protein